LSKAYDVIGRFSEDVDVTYDVRELRAARDGTLPKTNSQAKKWRDAIDQKLPAWVPGAAILTRLNTIWTGRVDTDPSSGISCPLIAGRSDG
jgi:hypothetical protein